ncbi:MAG: phage Gp37/Gp68 family protein [Ktedonobacteraceae bacterium]|nr:phage Gp37/Gp68 family protein [Ktedonobacteraceae bacterium]
MSEKSSIEWTEATWNPVTGCTEVSPGCDHCYARTLAERFRGTTGHPYQQGFDLRLWPERLDAPTRWKRPRLIFVNSMSDLFHKDIPDDFIVQVFCTMAHRAPQHTYQVLTKRPSRLVNTSLLAQIKEAIGSWPAHIWLGTSVETQDYTWRVDALRCMPAAVKFISAEPLLGPISFDLDGIAWVIVGAESGHGVRPMNEDWVRSLRDQALATGVALFYKQNALGGRKLPLPLLDGERWQQFPAEVPHD